MRFALQGWEREQYMALGENTKAYLMSEDAAVSMLAHSACARVNGILEKQGFDFVFTIHPSTRPSDSQVMAPIWHAGEVSKKHG